MSICKTYLDAILALIRIFSLDFQSIFQFRKNHREKDVETKWSRRGHERLKHLKCVCFINLISKI